MDSKIVSATLSVARPGHQNDVAGPNCVRAQCSEMLCDIHSEIRWVIKSDKGMIAQCAHNIMISSVPSDIARFVRNAQDRGWKSDFLWGRLRIVMDDGYTRTISGLFDLLDAPEGLFTIKLFV